MRSNNVLIKNFIPGILSLPESFNQKENESLPGVLLLHGFASNKNEVNNFYDNTALKLSSEKFVSLRIDFQGCGDSKITSEESSIDTMITDAISAYEYLIGQKGVDKNNIIIIGFSLGAAIAMLIAKQTNPKSLILISPALHLLKDFTLFLGKDNLSSLEKCSDPVSINLSWVTIKLSNKFYASLINSQPLKSLSEFKGDVLCVVGDKDFTHNNAKEIMTLSNFNSNCLHVIEDGDHIFNDTKNNSLLNDVISFISRWALELVSPTNNNSKIDLRK